ncbi:MAG: branched-chain amino acid ABC transporter permease [Candidatus Competibacterales bacterium]|nr:branched-chain amino acid ABC transporter permease [Candidatus Competibacterales bacterium]
MNALVSILFDGLAYGMVLFAIAVGLSVTMGLMGFINLAHGVFAMAGGYATVSLTETAGLGFVPALLLAAVLVAVASLPLERWLYAPLYRAGELDQVLLSIGLVLMATAAFSYAYGPDPRTVDLPATLSGQIDLGFRSFPAYRALLIAVGLGLALVLWLGIERTLLGARIRAAVANRRMAEAVGIDVARLFRLCFALGSGLAALGGGLAVNVLGLGPNFAIQYLVLFLIVVAVGGLGTVSGPFLAALLIGTVDTAGKYLWPAGGGFFIYALTVGLLLLRPHGLRRRF